ncbi:hypothetical protein ABMA80_15710 [Halobacteriovorax sp. FRX-3]|uniref:hypothetical protein n=1 Tax=Halobacteriovorax sp. FRX-3 TaxID=3157712 RepID=UPI0037228E1F
MGRTANSLSGVYNATKDEGACLQKEFRIPIAHVKCDWSENIRERDDEHIERWKHSMRNGEYIPSVLVEMREGVPWVIEGFHRYTSKEELIEQEGFEDETLLVKEWKGSVADRKVTMRASTSGLPLTFLQDAEVIAEIKNDGNYTPESLAKRLGISRTAVNNKLCLAEACEEIKQLVKDDVISGTTAVEAITQHGDKALAHLQHLIKKNENKGGSARVRGTGPKAFSQAKMRTVVELLLAGFDYEKFIENYNEIGDGDVDQEFTLDKKDMYDLVMILEEYAEFKDNK